MSKEHTTILMFPLTKSNERTTILMLALTKSKERTTIYNVPMAGLSYIKILTDCNLLSIFEIYINFFLFIYINK